ncbi:hypothetical protein [Caulobacter endophyticus]|uniref:Uncharacterized protein n=1 Tax=Caulobacter endophyticus TaxID=2172652 RepID=A0A2T9JJA2_9CAUL|nr:hypothetical protein [Caulobacter endophyticus]PVM83785.1 hypothetical protein DDF67_20145 [Caulobacter endophyticus]
MTGLSHSARLAPFQPETAWTLEGGTLVERRGARERRFDLAHLRRFRLAMPRGGGRRRALMLSFGRQRVAIASQSWRGPGVYEDRLESFSLLARAIAAVGADLSPHARFETAGFKLRDATTLVTGLLAVGAGALLLLAISSSMRGMAIDLAARMIFLLLLIFAALPWLPRGEALDPHDLPARWLP